MKAVVFTLGCKVNECESASLMTGLEQLGYEVSDELCFADLYLLNTCAVTQEAESKSRQVIARARKQNPSARILVCGCAAEKNAKAFAEKENVTVVVGAKRKEKLLALLGSRGCFVEDDELSFDELLPPKQTKTRSYVKVQDGCNHFCSYCIIPYLRGRSRSRSVSSCVAEIKQSGAAEVVLTGIDLSSYQDGENGLAGLIRALSDCDKRIRFGSLEESVITDELLSACAALPRFAPHFHLSLQSGSTAVLKKMNRHYTREDYLAKCNLIYRYFPDAAITTDLIVGFPTETEEQFAESLSIVKEAGFAQVHGFVFSPREGTPAAKMPDLPPQIKKERLHRLLAVAEDARRSYLQKFIGRALELLPEEESDGYTVGYTENYLRGYTNQPCEGLTKITVTELFRDGVKGE